MNPQSVYDVEELDLNSPAPGDFTQGDGQSTATLANVNAPSGSGRPSTNIGGSFLSQSPAMWLTLVAVLIAIKLLAEKAGSGDEFRTVKIGLENWTIVGLMAVTFLYVIKLIAYSIPSGAKWALSFRQMVALA